MKSFTPKCCLGFLTYAVNTFICSHVYEKSETSDLGLFGKVKSRLKRLSQDLRVVLYTVGTDAWPS